MEVLKKSPAWGGAEWEWWRWILLIVVILTDYPACTHVISVDVPNEISELTGDFVVDNLVDFENAVMIVVLIMLHEVGAITAKFHKSTTIRW